MHKRACGLMLCLQSANSLDTTKVGDMARRSGVEKERGTRIVSAHKGQHMGWGSAPMYNTARVNIVYARGPGLVVEILGQFSHWPGMCGPPDARRIEASAPFVGAEAVDCQLMHDMVTKWEGLVHVASCCAPPSTPAQTGPRWVGAGRRAGLARARRACLAGGLRESC